MTESAVCTDAISEESLTNGGIRLKLHLCFFF
jgi:hypothetical protein